MIITKVRAFGTSSSGAMMALMAVMLPMLATAGLAAVDYGNLLNYRAELQAATDSAAVGAAKELRLLDGVPDIDREAEMTRAARTMIDTNLQRYDWSVSVDVTEARNSMVQVNAEADIPLILPELLGAESKRITAHATAQLLGGEDVCAVALNDTDEYTLDLNNTSSITGPGCAIYSNSTHTRGLTASENARIEAGHICSAGGARGPSSSFRPTAHTDCAPLKDPLTHKLDSIEAVSGGPCVDTVPTTFDGLGTETLSPGRYCHDVTVNGDVELTLQPGVYVFDDATFNAAGHARISGRDVALVFRGNRSRLVFDGLSEVRLHGRVTGEMAGILMIAEPRDDGAMREFTVFSSRIRELVGTIYVPGDYLNIMTDSSVAADSAFTVVMARRIKLHGGATLTLNRDYASTTVPKAGGLRDYGGGLVLVK